MADLSHHVTSQMTTFQLTLASSFYNWTFRNFWCLEEVRHRTLGVTTIPASVSIREVRIVHGDICPSCPSHVSEWLPHGEA